MRLIHSTSLSMQEFTDSAVPQYAIVSHAWGKEEVSFQDMQKGNVRETEGLAKIKLATQQAVKDRLDWIWIDTCCIDKTSSAELSEAINSMYQWYKRAKVCYAYLYDVSGNIQSPSAGSDFAASRWFTRGWTLQELIAPSSLQFYGKGWRRLGSKAEHIVPISEITGIDSAVLGGANPMGVSIAQRMSWASKRQTTRIEDIAYCLMGIFDVNMPPLYGEGEKAFTRLQQEIIKDSTDQSIFAWAETGLSRLDETYSGMLTYSPANFQNSGKFSPRLDDSPYSWTNKGFSLQLQIKTSNNTYPKELVDGATYIAPLHCTENGFKHKWPAIYLHCLSASKRHFIRLLPAELKILTDGIVALHEPMNVFIGQQSPAPAMQSFENIYGYRIHISPRLGDRRKRAICHIGTYSPDPWDEKIDAYRASFLYERLAALLFDIKDYGQCAVLLGLHRSYGLQYFVSKCFEDSGLRNVYETCPDSDMQVLLPSISMIYLELGHFVTAKVEKIQVDGRTLVEITIG